MAPISAPVRLAIQTLTRRFSASLSGIRNAVLLHDNERS